MEDREDIPVAPYTTSDKSSLAYAVVKDGWPQIVTGAIDDVHRTSMTSTDAAKAKEGRSIVASLASLKYEIQHNRHLTPLAQGEGIYNEGYNERLKALGACQWFDVKWLFAECYLYRRIQTLFTLSKYWRSYDVFARQKNSAFRSSRKAMVELVARYRALVKESEDGSMSGIGNGDQDNKKRAGFTEMCELSLWVDIKGLLVPGSTTEDGINKRDAEGAGKLAEDHVLVNGLPAAYAALKEAADSGKKTRRVDIILDGAGVELLGDLALASYLLNASLATQIILHPKPTPWMVRNATPTDFMTLLNALSDPQSFFITIPKDEYHERPDPTPLSTQETADFAFFFQSLTTFHQEGQLILRTNPFWTTSHTYWDLPTQAPALFADLQQADLVVFKGDFNYRKLTADGTWDVTTPFSRAIGPLGTGSGVRSLALRKCESDVIVGLAEGVDERLRKWQEERNKSQEKRKWAWSKQWAIAQFCDAKVNAEV